jgi:hypothetical protein
MTAYHRHNTGISIIIFFIALCAVPTVFPGCSKKSTRIEPVNARRAILVVDVSVSNHQDKPSGPARAGFITFYNDYTYRVDISDDSLRLRVCSAFGRIIAEGKAGYGEGTRGRPDLSLYSNGISIVDPNFIYALVETAQARINSSNAGMFVYFNYR